VADDVVVVLAIMYHVDLQASTDTELRAPANADTDSVNRNVHLLLQSVVECFERVRQSKSDVLELKDIQLQAGKSTQYLLC